MGSDQQAHGRVCIVGPVVLALAFALLICVSAARHIRCDARTSRIRERDGRNQFRISRPNDIPSATTATSLAAFAIAAATNRAFAARAAAVTDVSSQETWPHS